MEIEDGQSSSTRIPCQFCGRKFAPESLGKHSNVCEKTSSKKRKTFDSAKQRIQGTELAEFAPTDHIKRYEPVVATPIKEKHIPAAKVAADTVHHVSSRKTNKTTSPLNKSSNYERCPYCDRSFGPKAFDRHLEWCKEQSIRINLTTAATQEAKERLEARTKYRAPSFKSKRSITKEKYSPKLKNPEPRLGSSTKDEERKEKESKMMRSHENEIKTKTLNHIIYDKPKPKENKEVNFIRQNVLRCSYRSRLPKKGENKNEKDKMNNNYQNVKKADFSGIEDWISANGTKIEPSQPPSKVSPTNSQLTNSMYDGYDPFTLAEHQMKELFGETTSPFDLHINPTLALNPKRPLKEDRLQKSRNKENISYEQLLQQQQYGPVKSKSCQTTGNSVEPREKLQNFKTSPTSAFSKYSASSATNGGDHSMVRLPTPLPVSDLLDKEEFNFLPPLVNNANAKRDSYGNNSRNQSHNNSSQEIMNNINRYPLISLSNISLCSSVSVDLPEDNTQHRKSTPLTPSYCKNPDRSCSSANSTSTSDDILGNIPLAMRSLSNQSNEKPLSKNQRKSLRMEHMLYGNEDQSKDTSIPNTPDLFEEKLEKLNSFLDADDFDLMNSFAEFECALQNSCCDTDSFLRGADSPDDKLAMKLERGDSIASKMSIDSAYNSLNRKSPILYETSNFIGGKTSTPEVELVKSSTLSPTSDFHDSRQQPKLSKFCHECGAKFPLIIAKFCCECGVRRLAI